MGEAVASLQRVHRLSGEPLLVRQTDVAHVEIAGQPDHRGHLPGVLDPAYADV